MNCTVARLQPHIDIYQISKILCISKVQFCQFWEYKFLYTHWGTYDPAEFVQNCDPQFSSVQFSSVQFSSWQDSTLRKFPVNVA